MAVEIKQALEREFEVILTAQELRGLTFAKLQELTDSGAKGEMVASSGDATAESAEVRRNTLLRSLGDEQMADKIIIPLNETDTNKKSDTYGVFIPGIEGVFSPVLYKLCKNIEIPIYALQLHNSCKEEIFSNLISSISKVSEMKHKTTKKKYLQFSLK